MKILRPVLVRIVIQAQSVCCYIPLYYFIIFILKRSRGCLLYTKKETKLEHPWFNSYAPELAPIFYYRDKTRVQMFYFLISTRVKSW